MPRFAGFPNQATSENDTSPVYQDAPYPRPGVNRQRFDRLVPFATRSKIAPHVGSASVRNRMSSGWVKGTS